MSPPPANILPQRPGDHEDAARVAISWLAERHRKGWRSAFEALLDHWRPEGPKGPEGGWQLNKDGMTMVSINAGEWLIARGQIHARGGLREINSYLLGHDGPYLTQGQKAWIAQLRERPLRLYRVTDVRPGEGLTLVDELDAQAEPQAVRERSGSQSARPGMLMGTRIMQLGDATDRHRELSGAIYPFGKLRETQTLTQVRQVLAGAAALKLHAENQRDLAETEIARAWMAQWFEPAPLPQIRDAATGEPMLLVTDRAGPAGGVLPVPVGRAGHREMSPPGDYADERWLGIEAINSSHAICIMEDCVDPCDDPRLGRTLVQALQQRMPFLCFKHTLADHNAQSAAWFAFERQAMEVMVHRRCKDNGITPKWLAQRRPPSS